MRFRVVAPNGAVVPGSECTCICEALAHLKRAPLGGRVLDDARVVYAKRLTARQALRIAEEETARPGDDDG